MEQPSVAALAREFHEDGFVALEDKKHVLSTDEVASLHELVMKRFDQYIALAEAEQIDLSLEANSEVIPGFYVRKGGRIDMQLIGMDILSKIHPLHKRVLKEVHPIDPEVLHRLEEHWRSVVDAIFTTTAEREHNRDQNDAQNDTKELEAPYYLEYVGCVVARPADEDQNWHLDGVHRDLDSHQAADRINVFVPLVAIAKEVGGTEMKRRSQFRDNGQGGTTFDHYAHLESITHYAAAGTPIIMDYRIWHRGKANRSSVARPLMYFKYSRRSQPVPATSSRRLSGSECDEARERKKRKRIVPVSLGQ
ncbi:hypothetical protein Poli38472_009456 [Pythium oligandrum]|uniref:Phytanoyl-CoA dioxygenase n=1 Tax=Pythium oligandrum TaxID=41045 RepID=A0A8K1FKR1_PYTOL|nr:hypothetical protein Poli38472_009456 [Pythium oligandrum]|eukprot:TMW61963.1 hypothetical protein Poli38472_009456 [Pythium oligandrum]